MYNRNYFWLVLIKYYCFDNDNIQSMTCDVLEKSTSKFICFRRSGSTSTLCVRPNNDKCYYFRLFLVDVCGPMSFQQLKTINGYLTYCEACQLLQLLENDLHWDNMLKDSVKSSSPYQIRTSLAIIIPICFPSKWNLLPWCTRKNWRNVPNFITFGVDQIAEWSYLSIGFTRNNSDIIKRRTNCTFCLETASKHENQRSTTLQHHHKEHNGKDSTGI